MEAVPGIDLPGFTEIGTSEPGNLSLSSEHMEPDLHLRYSEEKKELRRSVLEKGGGRENSERSSVCKPSRNVSTKRLHCKAWLRPMRKWEWVRQKPRGRIEWKNAFVHWALIFHRHSKGDRSAGQGEGQEKGNSVFCILKSHENVSWSRLSAPSGGNLESLGLRL